jgi:hypothetical protein
MVDNLPLNLPQVRKLKKDPFVMLVQRLGETSPFFLKKAKRLVWHLSSFFTWTLGPVHIRGLGVLCVSLDQHTGFAEGVVLENRDEAHLDQTIILRWMNQLHGFFFPL